MWHKKEVRVRDLFNGNSSGPPLGLFAPHTAFHLFGHKFVKLLTWSRRHSVTIAGGPLD